MKLEVLGSSGGLARKWSGLPLIHVLRIGYNLLMASAAEAGRAPQLVILTCLLRLSTSEGTEWPSFPRVWMCACFNLVDWLDSLSIVTFVFGEVLYAPYYQSMVFGRGVYFIPFSTCSSGRRVSFWQAGSELSPNPSPGMSVGFMKGLCSASKVRGTVDLEWKGSGRTIFLWT